MRLDIAGRKMLGQEGYVEIHVMHRQGMSIRAIGQELGVSRNTVRKYLRAAQVPQSESRSAKPTKLDAYRDYLNGRVEAAREAGRKSLVLLVRRDGDPRFVALTLDDG